MHSGIDLKQPK